MILGLKIAGAVVVALLLIATILRVRKLRRDGNRELSKPVDRRLVSPPPSPYEPSRGFRIIDESGETLHRPPVERPRIDPYRDYVFSDSTPSSREVVASHARHSDEWFLSRSSNRSTVAIVLRRLAVVVLVLFVLGVLVTYYVDRHPSNSHPGGPRTTTTLSATTTSLATLPSSFTATSTSGDEAFYRVPAARYQVEVTGSTGPTWTVYDMGADEALEWQGTVASGSTESLVMVGESRITLGSPSNASVSVDGRPVVLPAALSSPQVLVFNAPTTAG